MPYTLNRRPDHTVEIEATLDTETVEASRKRILETFRRKARIPGFRPGKAPLAVVRSHFGAEVEEELTEKLSEEVFHEVVDTEESFVPLTPLAVREARVAEDGTFHLEGELEVRPVFEIPPIENLSLPEIEVAVSDADIDEELTKVRAEQAAWEPVDDGEAENGMLVELDIHGEVIEGEGEPFHNEGVRFVLGEEGVFQEIQEALIGVRPGEERTVEKTFDEDFQDENAAGKTFRYRLVVQGIKRQILPDLDDELAKGMGFDDVEALRQRVREVLERTRHKERRSQWRRALLDQLEEGIDRNQLPGSLVRDGLREDLERYAYMMAMQGKSLENEEVDWQEISARMEPEVRTRVLDSLILEQLAEQWGIDVPEDDVRAYIEGDARQKGVPPAEHMANLAKEGQLDGIRQAARLSATVDELIRRVGAEVE
ncbi:MAG: trigger factor [Acidobacteria bacterium]|nr:trigger factor [Acidobacteriota bacterium]